LNVQAAETKIGSRHKDVHSGDFDSDGVTDVFGEGKSGSN